MPADCFKVACNLITNGVTVNKSPDAGCYVIDG